MTHASQQPWQICWLCEATKGLETMTMAFTDFNDDAPFWSTFQASHPWNATPPYATLPGFAIGMIMPDLLHVWSLGVAPVMGGSILKVLLQGQTIFDGHNLDTRFAQATSSLKAFAKLRKFPLRMKKLTKTRLRWATRSYPELACSGYDAYVICLWLQEILTPHTDEFQDFCTLLWSGNRAISLLYANKGWWLEVSERETLRTVGHVFVLTFARLAYQSMTSGLLLFRMKPKMHLLHHLFRSPRLVNPARYATWMDEDFLKKLGKILKMTHAVTAQQRTLQRYLLTLPETIRSCMRR